MQQSDSGFGPLTAPDEDNERPAIELVTDKQIDKEEIKRGLSSMCKGGYHGMCTLDRFACSCSCHQATVRKPIQ